jgi:hypothetical protein
MSFNLITHVILHLKQHLFLTHNVQGEHKVFPIIQIFITRKVRGIQTYYFKLINT